MNHRPRSIFYRNTIKTSSGVVLPKPSPAASRQISAPSNLKPDLTSLHQRTGNGTQRLREDRHREVRSHDPVGLVDDLRDFEVRGHAAQDIGVLSREAVGPHQVVYHRPHRRLGALHQIGANPGRRVVTPRIDLRREGPGGGELRGWQLNAFAYAQTQSGPHRRLDGRDADLTVALRSMRIPAREQGALDPGREEQCRADVQEADIHVAPKLAWRHDGNRSAAFGSNPHRPQEWGQRDPDVVAELRLGPSAEIP